MIFRFGELGPSPGSPKLNRFHAPPLHIVLYTPPITQPRDSDNRKAASGLLYANTSTLLIALGRLCNSNSLAPTLPAPAQASSTRPMAPSTLPSLCRWARQARLKRCTIAN